MRRGARWRRFYHWLRDAPHHQQRVNKRMRTFYTLLRRPAFHEKELHDDATETHGRYPADNAAT
jgi:hypothetical protein